MGVPGWSRSILHITFVAGVTDNQTGRKQMNQKIAPVAIQSLKDSLTYVYWYKSDLRSFLTQCLSDPSLLSRLNWDDVKREIVGSLVDYMARNQAEYQGDLLRLMTEVAKIDNFAHLERLEDGDHKAARAEGTVEALREHLKGHQALAEEQEKIEERREAARERRLQRKEVKQQLESLKHEYYRILDLSPQKRGYALETVMYGLFELFDLDPKASFRTEGEQIDGSFSFDGTDYLFEAKWEDEPTPRAELDTFDGKIRRKLENTLGLFLSINGFSEDGVKTYSGGRALMILMDGADLMAVLEGRIDLVTLLLRKRRCASQTGNIFLRIHELLG